MEAALRRYARFRQHVPAIGDMLPVWGDPPSLPNDYDALLWLNGWAADPAAFKWGLDLSTRELTPSDRTI